MKFLPLCCLGVALLAACRKDDLVVCPPATTGTLADVWAAAPPVQRFDIDLAQAQTLHTTGGATLAFPANALLLPDGRVAAGRATVRVRELHSVGDMLLAGLHTNVAYYNDLLVSAGEFNIQVWQGAIRLHWNPISSTSPSIPPSLSTPVPTTGQDTTLMYLWNLISVADTSGWRHPIPTFTFRDSPIRPVGGFYRTVLPTDTISWLNFDQYWFRYYFAPPKTLAEVYVPAGSIQTKVYLRAVGYTTLCRTDTSRTVPNRYTASLPVGSVLQAIVLQADGEGLYYGTQQFTLQPGVAVFPTMQALSAAEIVRRIRQL